MLILAIVACSSGPEHADSGREAPDGEVPDGETAEPADTGTTWHPDTALPDVSCTQADGDPEADCPGCGLDLDTTLTCTNGDLWYPPVGPTADGAWFVGCWPGYAYELAQGRDLVEGTVRGVQWNGVECDTLALPDGTRGVLVNETVTEEDWEGGLAYDGGAGRETLVERGTYFVDMLGIALVGGVPTVWYGRDGEPGVATRGDDGSWTSTSSELPRRVDWRRVMLGPGEAPVGIGHEDDELVVWVAGAEHTLGEARYPFEWEAARPPPEGLPSDAADAVLVRLTDAGLAVDFVRPEGVVEHVLADTTRAVSNCEEPDPCSGTCEELYSGLEGAHTFAAARASDGGAWVGWLTTSFDRTVTFDLEYQDYSGYECERTESDDQSFATLHLVHVAEDGGVTERLSIVGPRPATAGSPFGQLLVRSGLGRVVLAYPSLAFELRVFALPEAAAR